MNKEQKDVASQKDKDSIKKDGDREMIGFGREK